jgi:hypothetical protein
MKILIFAAALVMGGCCCRNPQKICEAREKKLGAFGKAFDLCIKLNQSTQFLTFSQDFEECRVGMREYYKQKFIKQCVEEESL